MQHRDTLLVTNVDSNTVTLFDEAGLNHKISLPVGTHPHEVVVSPCGNFALVSNYGDLTGKQPGATLSVIDIVNEKIAGTIQLRAGSRPHGIVFISSHDALVTAQGVDALLVVHLNDDFSHGEVVKTIHLPVTGAHMVTVTKDFSTAYVGCFSGYACKVNLVDESVQSVRVGKHAEGVALTPDEKQLFVSDMQDHHVAVVDTEAMTVTTKIKTHMGPSRVFPYNDGKSILVLDCIAGKSEILDVPTLKITNTFNSTNTYSRKTGKFGGGFFGALPVPVNAVIKEDQTAYITNLYAGVVSHIDLRDGNILSTFEADVCPDGVALSRRLGN